jgi:hypothetical protein
VMEVPGGLTGQARVEAIGARPPLFTMAVGARLQALGHAGSRLRGPGR